MSSDGKTSGFVVLAVVLTAAVALIAPRIQAASLRSGGSGAIGASVGSRPGEVMWTYYDTSQPATVCTSTNVGDGCGYGGDGDNILRLINPNGNANLGFGAVNDVCAMIYVFDDNQEMGECCGCPLSPADLRSFSVEHDLTDNWIFGSNPDANRVGAIAVVASAPNVDFVPPGSSSSNDRNCPVGQTAACNSGCDPTSQPGYAISNESNLFGGIVHNQTVGGDGSTQSGLTEVPLFDDAGGDQNNLIYLQKECAVLVGNGSGAGFCHCPIISNTPTATATATGTPTPTATGTPTSTTTTTPTPTGTATATETPTPTATATETPTPTATSTETPTPTATATETPTPTATPTDTPTPTATATDTPTPTATPTDTPTPTATETATPTPAPTPFGMFAFVTAGTFTGSLGGTAGGDSDCQTEATTVGLPGTYKAWLLTASTSPSTTFTQSTIPYILADGTEVAANWAGLISGTLLNPIDEEANQTLLSSVLVWTGTTASGTAASDKCQGFASANVTANGAVGSSSATDTTWSQDPPHQTCNNTLHLYCFEQ